MCVARKSPFNQLLSRWSGLWCSTNLPSSHSFHRDTPCPPPPPPDPMSSPPSLLHVLTTFFPSTCLFFHPMLPLPLCHHHALSSHLPNAFLFPRPPPPTPMFLVLLVSYDLAFNHCLFVCERELVHVPPCELLQCVCTVWVRMCCQEGKAAKVVSSF